jgi:long-chain acyl-CoA synthetase
MRAKFGGKLRLFVSGGGALSPNTQKKLKNFFGVPVVQGYGMTETCGATLVASALSELLDSVGVPTSCVEIRIESSPEYVNIHGPNSGELLVRGPAIFKGYFGNPTASRETIDTDGFMRTGDIVKLINEKGEDGIRIVGRAKEIFKLASGNYIVPARMEAMYMSCVDIEAIMVEPSRGGQYLVALVNLKDSVERGDLSDQELNESQVKDAILGCMQLVDYGNEIPAPERIRNVYITKRKFGPDAPEFNTPTLKMKRKAIAAAFRDVLDQL